MLKVASVSESQKSCFSCRVPLKAEGAPLAAYLADRFTYYKQEDWQRMVEEKHILLNGEVRAADTPVHAGDEIKYFTQERPEPKVPTKI